MQSVAALKALRDPVSLFCNELEATILHASPPDECLRFFNNLHSRLTAIQTTLDDCSILSATNTNHTQSLQRALLELNSSQAKQMKQLKLYLSDCEAKETGSNKAQTKVEFSNAHNNNDLKESIQQTNNTVDKENQPAPTFVEKEEASSLNVCHWSMGRPLATLVELEYETDKTTPGSRRSIGTTTTPWTPASRHKRTGSSSNKKNVSFTPSTPQRSANAPKKAQTPTTIMMQPVMETTNDEDCHNLDDDDDPFNFSSDDDNDEDSSNNDEESSFDSQVTTTNSHQLNDTTWDDSAMYCPTIVQNQTATTRDSFAPFRRPRCIHVNTASCPSPANLTMDVTTNDFVMDDNDNSVLNRSTLSTETAFLDRYRIDRDDASPHGFCVVPNPRRAQREQMALTIPKQNNSFQQAPPIFIVQQHKICQRDDDVNLLDEYDLGDESLLVSPMAAPHRDNADIFKGVKNYDVDISNQYSESATTKSRYFNDEPSVSHDPATKHEFIPTKLHYAKAASFSPRKSRTLRSLQQRLSLALPRNQGTMHFTPLLQITQEEYDAAPQYVRKQVTLLAVQLAIDDVNHAGQSVVSDALAEQLGRTLLMALCHWRRLILRRPFLQDDEVVFEICVL